MCHKGNVKSSSLGKQLLEVCTHSITLQLTTGRGLAFAELGSKEHHSTNNSQSWGWLTAFPDYVLGQLIHSLHEYLPHRKER